MTDATGSPALRMQLQRRGPAVSGLFSVGLGLGSLEGRLLGQRLVFRWRHAGGRGAGIIQAGEAGTLTGTWGQGQATGGSGRLSCEGG